MLTHLHLENFKSWQALDMPLANINLLFGANNSGKSSILQALLLLKQTVFHFDRSVAMHLGGLPNDWVDLGSYKELVNQHIEKDEVGIDIKWLRDVDIEVAAQREIDSIPHHMRYSVMWSLINSKTVLQRLAYEVGNRTEIVCQLGADGQYSYDLNPAALKYIVERLLPEEKLRVDLESCYSIKIQASTGSIYLEASVEAPKEFERLMEKIRYIGPLRLPAQRTYQWGGSTPQTIGKNGENTIEILLAAQRKADTDLIQQVSTWLAKMGIADQFLLTNLDPQSRFYEARLPVGETEASLADMGFGISQILPIIVMLLTAPEQSIILLEQPELHLHPAAQTHLADLMLDAAEHRHLQLIVESHSEHLLRRLQRRIAEEEAAFATPETIKLYFCELGKPIIPVEVNRFGQITNWPKNFFGGISQELDAIFDAGLTRRQNELQVHE